MTQPTAPCSVLDGVCGFWACIVTDGGGHEAVAVERHVVVGVLGHLRLLISQTAQGAGGAGVLLAAALGLHCQENKKYIHDITGFPFLKYLFVHNGSWTRQQNRE